MKAPKRPSGVSRGSHPSHVADGRRTSLDRSYAQKIRSDHQGVSFQSAAARATFWANQTKALARQEDEQVTQSLDVISQGSLNETGTTFRSANIESATLESAPAPTGTSDSAQATLAGLGPDGIAPPPR